MPVQIRKRAREDDTLTSEAASKAATRAKRTKPNKPAAPTGVVKVVTNPTDTITSTVPPVPSAGGTSTRMLFLLRAVNVSGSNPCNMKRLIQLTTSDLGWGNAQTYLQSGNLAADVHSTISSEEASEQLRLLLAKDMKCHCTVIPRTLDELDILVAGSPYSAAATADAARVHGFFLSSVPTKEGLAKLEQKPKKDDGFTWDGGRHLYLSYPNGAGRAALTGSVIEKSLGIQGTSRNWRSVLAVRDLLRE